MADGLSAAHEKGVIHRDLKMFLLNATGGQSHPYTVIVNWPELLRAGSDDR